jgi:hypothetical protein
MRRSGDRRFGDRSRLIQVRGGGFELAGRVVEPHGINSYPLLQLLGRGRGDAV